MEPYEYGLSYPIEDVHSRTMNERLFQIVVDECHRKGLDDIVNKVLKSAIHLKYWTRSEKLVEIVSKHVKKETENGGDGVWDTWYATIYLPTSLHAYFS